MRIERKGLIARALVVLATILAMVAVVERMAHRAEQGHRYAQMIAHSAATARTVIGDDAEDQNSSEDEMAAGVMWAQHNHPRSAADCPRYSLAFRRGCASNFTGR
jgi:hypothetical protein